MTCRVSLLLLIAIHSMCAADFAAHADAYIDAYVKQKRFMGSVLVARNGEMLLKKGYGFANLEFDIPNTPDTKFRLGSITKQFTATAILQLEQRGKLKTTDRICQYLESCPERWKPITIHHLLTHTSGIPNFTNFPDYMKTMMIASRPAETMKRFRDKDLEFDPGTKHSYSNSGYTLLGLIVEKASGISYEQYVQRNIFDVVGMNDSGHDAHEPIIKKRATGYTPAGLHAPFIDQTIPIAAGDLYSTVEDLYKWDQALYTEQVLTKAALDKMFAPFLSNYAYGWIVERRNGHKRIGHGGGINGFSTYIGRYPDDRATVIVLSNNTSPDTGRIAADLGILLFGGAVQPPVERRVISVNPAIYEAYAGKYELGPAFVLTVTREGNRLMTQATGQAKVEVYPESETKYFLKVVDAQLSFVKDPVTGKVTHLVLHQHGRNQTAKKIE